MSTQRYLSTDDFFEIQHKIPEMSNAEERETYLPEKYDHYCLYCLDKDGNRIGQTKNITYQQQQLWLKGESEERIETLD